MHASDVFRTSLKVLGWCLVRVRLMINKIRVTGNAKISEYIGYVGSFKLCKKLFFWSFLGERAETRSGWRISSLCRWVHFDYFSIGACSNLIICWWLLAARSALETFIVHYFFLIVPNRHHGPSSRTLWSGFSLSLLSGHFPKCFKFESLKLIHFSSSVMVWYWKSLFCCINVSFSGFLLFRRPYVPIFQ